MLQVESQLKHHFLYLLLLFPAMGIVILPACSVEQSLQVVEHSIVVREFTGDISQSTAIVKGVAINTGAWAITDCRIDVTYYDCDRNPIGTVAVSNDKLEPGDKWNFIAELKGSSAWQVASYDISTGHK